MSTERTVPRDGEPHEAEARDRERSVEERAEEIVEQVSERAVRFVRRLAARAREEAEDIVAEAQTMRRRGQRRE
jgi:hypothetical protein